MRVLLGLALAVLTGATACGENSARAGRGLTYYESYDPRSLDPALSTDVPTGEMVTLAYDGLTQFDADGRLLPGLADRWTAGQDASGRKYVFHLRPGAKFHDGTPLTAAAVRASLLRVLSPATKGGRPWPLYPIAGAEAYAAGRERRARAAPGRPGAARRGLRPVAFRGVAARRLPAVRPQSELLGRRAC